MKPAAVALLQERARAAGLTNVSAVRGMIETFTEQPFDVALALHACGNATDAALLLAAARRAAYVVSPCCVGGWVRGCVGVPGAMRARGCGLQMHLL